jgi:hypothetical protein
MEPEAALAFVQDHGEDVFAVGRNGSGLNFSAAGELLDGEILKRRRGVAIVEAIQTVADAGENDQRA